MYILVVVKGDLALYCFLRQKYVKKQCKIQNAKILISPASAQSLRFLASNAAAKVHTVFELRKDTKKQRLKALLAILGNSMIS